MAALTLYLCAGGEIALPAQGSALCDRADGGNLLVNPRRRVWERSALTVPELTAWAHLVAAAGEAMLTLPQLEGGCLNYWEAGNWALNDAAPPVGPKTARDYRRMHLHLIGRSPRANSPDLVWGESPNFPRYADKDTATKRNALLTPDECALVVAGAEKLLRDKFGMSDLRGWERCPACAYPTPKDTRHACGG